MSRGKAMSGRTDLQRHDVVGQSAEGEGPGEQVEHEAAVHGEQLVVGLERDQRRGGVGQLGPDDQRHDAGDEEQHQRGDHVALADHLVVGGGQPVEQAGRAFVVGVVARARAGRRGRARRCLPAPRDRPGQVARWWWSCGSFGRGGRRTGVGRGRRWCHGAGCWRPTTPPRCRVWPAAHLGAGPQVEGDGAHRPHAEQHLRVVEPADLGALPVVGARVQDVEVEEVGRRPGRA